MIPVIETFCDLFFGDFPASSVRLLLSLSTKLFSKNAFSVFAKAVLTGEEYFPASFFCLRGNSSWNDDIFDTEDMSFY